MVKQVAVPSIMQTVLNLYLTNYIKKVFSDWSPHFTWQVSSYDYTEHTACVQAVFGVFVTAQLNLQLEIIR